MGISGRLIVRVVVMLLAGCIMQAAMAHHSAAMYDMQKRTRLVGTVKEFQWTNPHCWIQLLVPDGAKTLEWSIETVSPPGLRKHAWTRDAIKAGDKAIVEIAPLKSGERGGLLVSVTVDGKMIGDGPL